MRLIKLIQTSMTIYEKLLEVQKEIGAIKKDSKNSFFKSNYFDINSLLAEVKPVLNEHGFILTQGLTHIDGKLALSTRLDLAEKIGKDGMIEDYGEKIEYVCPLPETQDAQKAGSAITYFRRYALQSLLALEAEDDDGESSKPATKQPLKESDKDEI